MAWFRRGILVAALFSLFFFYQQYQGSLLYLLKNTQLWLFVLSIVIGCLSSLLLANVFKKEIRLEQSDKIISGRKLVKIYYVGQIAKYIPGKIWTIIYQTSSLEGKDSLAKVFKANYYLLIFSLSATAIVAGISLTIVGSPFVGIFLVFLASSGFVFINHSAKWILIKFQHFKLISSIANAFVYRQPLNIQFIDLSLFVLLNGITYFLFFISVGTETLSAISHIGHYTLAWIAGVLSFFFPAGAGIREFVFVSLSQANQTQLAELVSLAIYLRVWQMIQDFLGFVVSSLYFKVMN
jgi:hypothetical protein